VRPDWSNDLLRQVRQGRSPQGATAANVATYNVDFGALPRHGAECEIWVIIGSPSPLDAASVAKTCSFLRAAASFGRTIYGMDGGEQFLHLALSDTDCGLHQKAAAKKGEPSKQAPTLLYQFDPTRKRVVPLA